MSRRRGFSAWRRIATVAAMACAAGAGVRSFGGEPAAVELEVVADGLGFAVFVTPAPGDMDRLFVLEKPGQIRLIRNGELLEEPFLDLTALVLSNANEQGLLGLAFHPDYQINGFFYVYYTDLQGDTAVDRFTVSTDPDRADADSRSPILAVDQPSVIHQAGWMDFGPDGLLYIALGDGGPGGDPNDRAQNTNDLRGKILRIDVDNGAPYAIPPDNPFAGGGGRGEIWVYGLRNPWRCSFDRDTGDLWISDVGESSWEEVNFQPATSPGGENFGWRCMEGNDCFTESSGCECDEPSLTPPIHTYSHALGCAIAGGYRYRGKAIPELVGQYLYADVCFSTLWSFDPGTGEAVMLLDGLSFPTSFGEDNEGELYIVRIGSIAKIIRREGPAADCNHNGVEDEIDITDGTSDDVNGDGIPDECTDRGDFNGDGIVDSADLASLLGSWGPCPPKGDCLADLNGDGVVNSADLAMLLGNWG